MTPAQRRLETLVVGQSGGGTPVINASLAGVLWEARARGLRQVYGLQFGVRGLLEERFVDLGRLTEAALSELTAAPSAALGLCRYKLSPAEAARAVGILQRRNVDAFLYIGGNDSAETTLTIAQAAAATGFPLCCLAIPKTIDNDLAAMDHSPGFGSAARFVAAATRDLGVDAWAMQREEQVRILEVYGRDTGWLAAASVLARSRPEDAPHLVLVPERPFVEADVLARVEELVARYGYAMIVVGEMLRDGGGRLVGSARDGRLDAFGHGETRRPGAFLKELIEQRLHLRAKDDRPGSLQKVFAASASPVDRCEAYGLGQAAVRAALAGENERIMVLRRVSDDPYVTEQDSAPLVDVAGKVRPLPDAFLDAAGQPNELFRRYAAPLIGGDLAPHPRVAADPGPPPAV